MWTKAAGWLATGWIVERVCGRVVVWLHSPRWMTTMMRSAAADRNKNAILDVLRTVVPVNTHFSALETASGTGQHVIHFAQHLPRVSWQPSDCDEKSLHSIRSYIKASGLGNIKEPLLINTCDVVTQWAEGALVEASYDLILCINMVHISEWSATEGLFQGSGYYLKPGGTLATYGPYKIHGSITPESNMQFDMMLKQQNNAWGLRDVDDLEKLAKENNLLLQKIVDVPANNKILLFTKMQ